MKKLLFALVIGLVFVAALTTTALADNGPHGGVAFSSNGSLDACASCHRAHTAQSTNVASGGSGDLIKTSSIYGLCMSCHDGTGAYTNVKYGIYDTSTMSAATQASLTASFGSAEGTQGDAGAPLFGGGFVSTVESHSWAGNQSYKANLTLASSAVVSGHSVDDSSGTWGAGNVWGSGNYNTGAQSATGGANPTLAMTCTSCHDPHGYAGLNAAGQPMPTYRLLRYTPTSSNGFEITTAAGQAFWTNTLATTATIEQTSSPYAGVSVLEPGGMGATSANNYTATSWWYTINTNALNPTGTGTGPYDPFLVALDKPYGATATTQWHSVTFGPNDPAPYIRGATYKRPAAANSTSLFCFTPDPTDATQPANPPATNNNCTGALGTVIGTSFDNSSARLGISFFCAECHDRYLSSSAGLTTSTTDQLFMFQHDSGATSTIGKNPNLTCVDCHNAHGTSATATTLASDPLSGTNGDSSGLKLDNREMCIKCHGTSVNFQYAP